MAGALRAAVRVAFLLGALLLAGCSAPGGEELPGLVVALGDSITVAANSAGQGEFPQHAWATGLAEGDGVDSFLERLRALRPDALGLNEARSGARVADLRGQAAQAARAQPDLVLVLIGANDACARPMTEPDAFRTRLAAAAEALGDTRVYALSVPDVVRLHEAVGENETARAIWRAYGICPAVLGSEATDATRSEVRARIEAYNAAIAAEAAARGWATDGGAVFAQAYAAGEVSPVDAFHPSLAGQARLAEVAWEAGPFASLTSS